MLMMDMFCCLIKMIHAYTPSSLKMVDMTLKEDVACLLSSTVQYKIISV